MYLISIFQVILGGISIQTAEPMITETFYDIK